MIIFTFPGYENFAKPIIRGRGNRLGEFKAARFPNGEEATYLKTSVRGKDCLVIGTNAPPADNLMRILLLGHTLKKEGARRVRLFLPYMAYSRSDKNKKGECWATKWLGKVLKASGFDEVITIDLHSERDKSVFAIPLKSIPAHEIFADVLKKYGDLSVVAPDAGALPRCRALAKAIGSRRIGYLIKKRIAGKVELSKLHGKIGERVVVYDDILDTGSTLVNCARKLKEAGVKEIITCVTHGLFTGDKWKELFRLGVDKIYCVDTVATQQRLLRYKSRIARLKLPFTIY